MRAGPSADGSPTLPVLAILITLRDRAVRPTSVALPPSFQTAAGWHLNQTIGSTIRGGGRTRDDQRDHPLPAHGTALPSAHLKSLSPAYPVATMIRMPTNTTSVRRKRLECQTAQPKPFVAAIISAATSAV